MINFLYTVQTTLGSNKQTGPLLIDINSGYLVVFNNSCENAEGAPEYINAWFNSSASTSFTSQPDKEWFNRKMEGFKTDVTVAEDELCVFPVSDTSPDNEAICYVGNFMLINVLENQVWTNLTYQNMGGFFGVGQKPEPKAGNWVNELWRHIYPSYPIKGDGPQGAMRFGVSLVPAETDWGWIPGYTNTAIFAEDSNLLFGDFDELIPVLRASDSVTLNITTNDDWVWSFDTSFFGFGYVDRKGRNEYFTALDTTYNQTLFSLAVPGIGLPSPAFDVFAADLLSITDNEFSCDNVTAGGMCVSTYNCSRYFSNS